MNVADYINRVASSGVLSPVSETKTILGHILGRPCFDLPKTLDGLSESEKKLFVELIEKRATRVPSVRVCGQTAFAGAVIGIEDGVFAPYPESESVVDYAVILAEKQGRPIRILDLGTGSGCLLVSLLLNLPQATGVGIDNNKKALDIARKNAERNGVQDRVEFLWNDWSRGIEEQFDLVISNPPRVRTRDIPFCLPEMKNHDPFESLDGGEDGLTFYRLLAEDFGRLAKTDGYGLFQTGPYAKMVQNIFNMSGFFKTSIERDYRHCPLCLIVHNHKTKGSALRALIKRLWARKLLSSRR